MHRATTVLLRDTISVTDDQWRGPSRLPGWSRGHVATHLARNADAFTRLVNGVRVGVPAEMYTVDRDTLIDNGAGRSGMQLQVDLDTSADQLFNAFHTLGEDHWNQQVSLRSGAAIPVRALPLARLTEVVVHHVDLDIGFRPDRIPEHVAAAGLAWTLSRLQSERMPALRLVSTSSDLRQTVAGHGDTVEVTGTTADLLCWIAGRGGRVRGGDSVTLPAWR